MDGEETITYLHEGDNPLATLQFHLYWNAFRDSHSTFQREMAVYGHDDFDKAGAGWMEIVSLRQSQTLIPASAFRYLHPDDDNSEDRTVAEVTLPEPVLPGATVTVRVVFRARFPKIVARAGSEHDFFMAGQWFPKLGVLRRNLWNTHQYHAMSEFFSDFGVYQAALTLPQAFVVAASGDLISETTQGGLKTVTYRSEDVHDFAWAAWPRFRRLEERWHNVRLELYYAPEHRDARRHLEAARATLEWFERHVGLYPYSRLVIVDVPQWASEAAGMEYPTLVTTTNMSWWMPRAVREPELITIHEVGHQYFYGMLASNEFEEAWLDEGITTYTEAAVADALYGPQDSWISLPGIHAGDAGLFWRGALVLAPLTDAVVEPSWRYWSPITYAGVTYAKSLFLLRTIEQMAGRERFEKALRLYFERWRFRHPTTRDFLDCVKEGTGQDLEWFFSQALDSPSALDYAIQEVLTEKLGEKRLEHHVRVRRLGDLSMPVEAIAHFEDSTSRTRFWNGRERWHDFVFESPAGFAWAEITTRPLEINRVDNSYAHRPSRGAAAKLAGLWAFLLQHLLELAAWLV